MDDGIAPNEDALQVVILSEGGVLNIRNLVIYDGFFEESVIVEGVFWDGCATEVARNGYFLELRHVSEAMAWGGIELSGREVEAGG